MVDRIYLSWCKRTRDPIYTIYQLCILMQGGSAYAIVASRKTIRGGEKRYSNTLLHVFCLTLQNFDFWMHEQRICTHVSLLNSCVDFMMLCAWDLWAIAVAKKILRENPVDFFFFFSVEKIKMHIMLYWKKRERERKKK